MLDSQLEIHVGRPANGRKFPVTISVGGEVKIARELNPFKADELDEFIKATQVAMPGLNGEAEPLRARLLQLARPKAKPKRSPIPLDWIPDRLSQQINAQELVRLLDGRARFNVSRDAWMFYRESEGRLVIDETGEVARTAKKVAKRTWDFVANPPDGIDSKSAYKHAVESEKAAGVSAMMKLAQTEPGISIVASDLDRDGYLLNVLNGVYDFQNQKFRDHQRTDFFTKLSPVLYDPSATCPLWESVLNRIMASDEEMISYLRRIAGLSLTADVSCQELYICHGEGANGKNLFWDTILGIAGDYGSMCADSLLATGRSNSEHPTQLADLLGRRLMVANETEEGAKLRVALVKQLTGNATIKARYMRQDYIEFPRSHKLILVTNNRPVISETTHAIWRRVRLIPFNVIIPKEEQDDQLLTKLRAEWSGILNWCIAGFGDFKLNGMVTPSPVKVATEQYRSAQDLIQEYIDERCIVGAKQYVARNEIFSDYQSWAKIGSTGTRDRNAFYDGLRHRGYAATMIRIGGQPTRVFNGIGLANAGNQYQQDTLRLAGVTP